MARAAPLVAPVPPRTGGAPHRGNITGWQHVRIRLAPPILLLISIGLWKAIIWGVQQCL